MPSVDRVGRYFPLSIVSPVSKGASALSFAISAARWFDAAERILLTVLSESEPDLNVFDRQVLELTQNLVDLDCLQRPPAQKSDAGEYWKLEVPGDSSAGLAMCSLAGGIIVDHVGPTSWWWTLDRETGSATYVAVRNLPSPVAYATLLGATSTLAIPQNRQHTVPVSRVAAGDLLVAELPATSLQATTDGDLHRPGNHTAPVASSDAFGETLSLAALINTPLDLSYESSSATETGKVRRDNEDAILDDAARGIWAVADGMGGHAAGRTASSAVIGALRAMDLPENMDHAIEAVTQTLQAVNRELRSYARHRRESRGLGVP